MRSLLKKIFISGPLSAALACASFPLPAAAADWEFASAVNFDTGKYGSRERTDSVYIPFTLKHNWAVADLSVTVPYVRQSNKGPVTRVAGRLVRAAGGTGAVINSPGSGLGDIIISGAGTLMLDGPGSFDLALAGKLKLPTASRKKGLGTGEPDESLGLEFAKEISPALTLLSDGYYTFVGEPAGADLNNEIMLDVGFYSPLGRNIGLTVLYETRSAVADGTADPRGVSGTFSYSAPGGTQFAGGATLGLSDGSPGLGIGAGFSLQF